MAAMDDSEFVVYPNTFGQKVSYKLSHGGYTYSRRDSKGNGRTRYYYCDQRKICNASIIWQSGKWSYGKGTCWEKNGEHTHHEPDNERCAVEIAKGKAKLMAKTDPYLTGSQILDRVKRDNSQSPLLTNNNAMKQSLLRVRKAATVLTKRDYATSAGSSTEPPVQEEEDDDNDDNDRDDVIELSSSDSDETEKKVSKSKKKIKVKLETKTPSSTSKLNANAKRIKTEKPGKSKEELLLFDSWGSDSNNRILVYTNLGNLKCTVQPGADGTTKVFITHESEVVSTRQ